MELKEFDRIRSAWAETVRGPGWVNRIVWVLVQEPGGALRLECLQPEEQPTEVLDLFDISEATNDAMLRILHKNCGKWLEMDDG